MKTKMINGFLSASALTLGMQSRGESKLLVNCAPVNTKGHVALNADSYNVTMTDDGLKFSKENGSRVPPLNITFVFENPVTVTGYGDTYAVAASRGKKGYMMFYANIKSKKGYVDINYYEGQNNTDGVLALKCVNPHE